MKEKLRKNDICLIVGIVVLACLLWGILRFTKSPGEEVRITVDGATIAVLPLAEDCRYPVCGPEGRNLVVVASGRVSISEADCPDKVCVRQGWISLTGESIVCLPHKLVVTIEGSDTVLDAVSG